MTSRLAPIPSKLDPVSSAASTRKKRPRPSTYANATASPLNRMSDTRPSSGTTVAARSVVATTKTGASRKIHVVVSLNTAPRRTSFQRSKYSCSAGAPFRPVSADFVRVATPATAGARSNTSRKAIAEDIVMFTRRSRRNNQVGETRQNGGNDVEQIKVQPSMLNRTQPKS